MPMSCKDIKILLNKSDLSELSDVQIKQIENHIHNCSSCYELYSRDMILASLFKHAEVDEEYIIPVEVMRAKINKRLDEPEKGFSFLSFIREPIVGSVSAVMLVLLVSLSLFTLEKNEQNQSYQLVAYEVNLNGIAPEFAKDHDIICDMLSSAGLDDASVDILGCERSCEVVIFDLKNKEEAELVVNIFQAIDKDDISTEVNQVKDYNQQVL